MWCEGWTDCKIGLHVMVAHDLISDKDYVLRGSAAMVVDRVSLVAYPARSIKSRSVILYVFAVLRRPFRMDN